MPTGRSQAKTGSRKGHLSPSQGPQPGGLNRRDGEELGREQTKSRQPVPYVLWEAWGIPFDSQYYRK